MNICLVFSGSVGSFCATEQVVVVVLVGPTRVCSSNIGLYSFSPCRVHNMHVMKCGLLPHVGQRSNVAWCVRVSV